MDIDNISFDPCLLGIIEAISKSYFVALDLEMSGIPGKAPAGIVKQSLQKRYEEIKSAAEKYQVLQIGITCVQEYEGVYVLRPYNFYLNPTISEDLGIERIWSYQNGAVRFLLKHGFRMEAPYTKGVSYLSREEATLAKQQLKVKLDKSKFDKDLIDIEDDDNIAFMDKVRTEISAWEKGKGLKTELMIKTRNPAAAPKKAPDLTSFDRRIVHQLVRAEYPHLTTITRGEAIIVKPLDSERENQYMESKKKQLRTRILRHTGFRWVFEALCGGNLDQIDLKMFAKDPVTGAAIFCDIDDYSARLNRARQALASRRPAIVGHNFFLDLVYFHKTFIGTLPATVEEFGKAIHELFPMVVDTKYLATHNCGNFNPASSLGDIEAMLRSQRKPELILHNAYGKYAKDEMPHEAGYDSYLTARVAIQLSTRLEALGTYIGDLESADGQLEHPLARLALTADWNAPRIKVFLPLQRCSTSTRVNGLYQESSLARNMPPFQSDFWHTYGNKLRAFGTFEKMLDLQIRVSKNEQVMGAVCRF